MERTAERAQEHYCWVKIVASQTPLDACPVARRIPEHLRRAFDSAHLLRAMGDQNPGDRPPPSPTPPPPISPNSPPPPPPPGIQRADERMLRAAGARHRPPAWRIERGSPLAGGFGMEVAGVSGDRHAAWQWIESEDGRRWREGAVGLDLVLFSA